MAEAAPKLKLLRADTLKDQVSTCAQEPPRPPLYVATNLLSLAQLGTAVPLCPSDVAPPAVLSVTVGAARSDTGRPEVRPFYRLTPAVYAWIMCRLKELESRAYGLDGKNEDDLGVMPSADARWLLNGEESVRRFAVIQEYVNERWAEEWFDKWRELLDEKGRPPALPRIPRR
jgi:hypothetical protein